MGNVASGTAQVIEDGDIPLGTDGAAHLFVNPTTGNDDNLGLTAATPFRTINRTVDRVNEWLALELNLDLVVELANGTYAEDVEFILQHIPKGRVVVRGNDTTMTVVASGALTAATAYLITDAAAAFGAANEQAGLLVEVFNPLAPATTRQIKTIRNHTGTAIVPIGPFNPIPAIGWTYRVLTPGAVISGQAADPFDSAPALHVMCPWSSDLTDGISEFPQVGPVLWFAYIRVTSLAATPAIYQQGGMCKYMGVVVDGAGIGFRCIDGGASFYGIFTTVVDPVFGASATFSSFVDSCLGARSVGGSIRFDNAGVFGAFVARNASPFFFNSNAILFGGAVIGAFLQFSEQSDLSLVGGGVETADPLLPYLARACPATPAFQIREGSRAEIRDVLFEVLALGVGAFHVNSDAYLDLRANIVAGVGDVPGIGVHCENAGKAMIAAAVTFTTGSTNTRVGNGASGNGDGTFAALLPTAPLYDDSLANGRGGGGVQPGSRAAIWEA